MNIMNKSNQKSNNNILYKQSRKLVLYSWILICAPIVPLFFLLPFIRTSYNISQSDIKQHVINTYELSNTNHFMILKDLFCNTYDTLIGYSEACIMLACSFVVLCITTSIILMNTSRKIKHHINLKN